MANETYDSTIPLPPRGEVSETLHSSGFAGFSQREEEIGRQISARQYRDRQNWDSNNVDRSEYLIPVRLSLVQRRIYRSLILENAEAIETFCQDPTNHESRSKIEGLVVTLTKATIHPLLVASIVPSSQVSNIDEAWYIIQASSKFEVLVEVIEALREQAVRIAVISDSSRTADLLKIICQGLHIRHISEDSEHPSVTHSDHGVGKLELVILTAGEPYSLHEPADLCIAFGNEGTYNYGPVIRLIAKNTAEHVLVQNPEDTVTSISIIANLSGTAGSSSNDGADIAQKLVQFICGKALDIEPLPDLIFPSSQYDVLSYTASASNGDKDQPSPTKKRCMDDLSEQVPDIIVTKIDGMDVHTEAQGRSSDSFELRNSMEIQQISDGEPKFSLDETVPPLTVFDSVMSQNNDLQQAQFIAPARLEKTPTQVYKQTRKEIWAKQTPDQEKLVILEADMERMMLRFDDLREECRTYSGQKEEALQRAASLQKRLERVTDEARALRLEKNELKMELDRMRMPTLPEEASPEYVKLENIRLRTELDKSKKSSESKTQDFEFVRQQYQQSSNAAAALAVENESLQSEVVSLKNKTESGTGYKMAVLRSASEIRALREELENTTLRNNVLIEQLRRMRDEKLAGRGREGRRDAMLQDRKRAASASDVGHRKKVEKIGASRLSVASLMSPVVNTEDVSATYQGHVMLRGQSHDSRAYGRERNKVSSTRRDGTPF